jgi:putative transposase
LFEQIGRLKLELEWLKKKLPDATRQLCALVEPQHETLSVRRQCALVGLNRANFA